MSDTSPPRKILICDETLRDGDQGGVVMTPAFKVNHILEMEKNHFADVYRMGWHSNPTDQAVLDYLKRYYPNITKKLVMNTLLYPSDKVTPGDNFDAFRKDDRFGISYVFTKGRREDVDKDLGISEEEALKRIERTVRFLKEANPGRPVGLGIEHAFAAYLSNDKDFVIRSCIAALKAGCDRLTLADTDGAMRPEQVYSVIKDIGHILADSQELKAIPVHFRPEMISVHTHDDLGLAAANVISGLHAGAGMLDSSFNNYGERTGNASSLQVGAILAQIYPDIYHSCINADKLNALRSYADTLHEQLGTAAGDRAIGGRDSYNAVGGMHAAGLLRAFYEAREKLGISIHEFMRACGIYRGSYSTIPPQDFGREIAITLSPVAGRANVQFILETLGVSGVSKDDPRLQEVLDRVKKGECERGENYRGKNNANAQLLLADVFGLREYEGRKNTVMLDTTRYTRHNLDTRLRVNGKSVEDVGILHPDEATSVLGFKGKVDKFFLSCTGALKQLVPDVEGYKLQDAKDTILEVGNIVPRDEAAGDFSAQGEETVHSVKLTFKDNLNNTWLASGTGKTAMEAAVSAVRNVLDYSVYQMERQRAGAGCDPAFSQEALARVETTAERSNRIRIGP